MLSFEILGKEVKVSSFLSSLRDEEMGNGTITINCDTTDDINIRF